MVGHVTTDSTAEVDAANACIESYLKDGGDFTLTVKGDCMSPALHDADKIIIRRKTKYYSGDVIAYYCPYKKIHVVHRLLGVLTIQHRRRYFTKADNGDRPDALLEHHAVLGYAIDVPVNTWLRAKYFILFIYWLAASATRKAINEFS